jgi:signal transduction histidine kinase
VLAAEVTHELRTPLNALSINLQLLKRELKKENGDDDQMLWNLVGILENEIKRINNMVEGFIRFCRVPPLKLRKWDVMDIVSDVLQLLGEQASQAGITIEIVQENTQPLIALIDVDQMCQVLLNLITNAIRATRQEGEIIIASSCPATSG